MHVTQCDLYRNILSGVENLNETLSRVSQQISSGKKLSQLMDCPAASSEILALNEQSSEIDQYQSNIDTSTLFLQTGDSALNEVNNLVTSIYTRGSQAASDSVNDDSRAALASEIRTLRDQVLSLANMQVRGRYIFAGTSVLTAPFEKIGDSITYKGNGSVNSIAVDDGMETQDGVSGSAAFNPIFSAIGGMLTAMDGNDRQGIKDALSQFSSAQSDLGQARERIGSNLSALQTVASNLDTKATNLTQRRSKLEDTDLAAAVIQLSQGQSALQAAISAGGKILSQRNLFDILG
jgi:flagellar hook-associated protein 3 FlgL